MLGLPIATPPELIARVLGDLAAIGRLARAAPAQLERLLELGEEMVSIGREVLALAESLDERAEAIMRLGERLDERAAQLLQMGATIEQLGQQMEVRGEEIVEGAAKVVETGGELITVLPAFERALEMATPLEGAIDRFGRLVDRLPGGAPRRRPESRGPRTATQAARRESIEQESDDGAGAENAD